MQYRSMIRRLVISLQKAIRLVYSSSNRKVSPSLLWILKPEHFEDLIPLVALYRPGPLGSGMVADFIDRRHGKKEVTYLHPILEPILKDTFGVILYQEQVMQIASAMGGFSPWSSGLDAPCHG